MIPGDRVSASGSPHFPESSKYRTSGPWETPLAFCSAANYSSLTAESAAVDPGPTPGQLAAQGSPGRLPVGADGPGPGPAGYASHWLQPLLPVQFCSLNCPAHCQAGAHPAPGLFRPRHRPTPHSGGRTSPRAGGAV